MPELPLLIFPQPRRAEKNRRYGGGGNVRYPDAPNQATRLGPQFQRLQDVMNQKHAALQNNSLGIQPEQALVLETIGPVDNFINAVRNVSGLEWLGEFEVDDIPPDFGFQDEKSPEKVLKGQLFLVMTDQRALQQLLSLFARWQQNPSTPFPNGLAPWKQAFLHLHSIRPWDAEDRIRDTGLFEDWAERIRDDQQSVPFEAELWFRTSPARRRQLEDSFRGLIGALGGEVVQQCVVPDIAYHGILGKIPINKVAEVMDHSDMRLLQCEDIMYLRPVGQCAIRLPDTGDESETVTEMERSDSGLPQGDPVIALLDGLPLAGHKLLSNWLTIDDPDGYESDYQSKERLHGTAMSSLICHGNLDEGAIPVTRPIYVRPILKPHRGFGTNFTEQIPEGVLPVDLVHRAVRRMFEEEDGELPVAPSIRIINLSICDKARPFDRGISPWARLLDWVSWKYNVVFIVSAGNHARDITLDVARDGFRALLPQERDRAVIKALAADTRHRRLLSPAESFNSLTLGATHTDRSTPQPNPSRIDPMTRQGGPSTISAHGPGYRRSIKPDIFLPGGRQFLREKMGTAHTQEVLQVTSSNGPPGLRVAIPGAQGELSKTSYLSGTSNAAALASRGGAILFDAINRLRSQDGTTLPQEYYTVLLKALLVHGADWAESKELFESALRTPENSRVITDYLGRFLGYGAANFEKVVNCTNQRVTILGIGTLKDEEADEFVFPLPPSLSAVTDKRRLTVTLAWLSPVNPLRQSYRVAHLWFDPKNNLAPSRMCGDHRAVQRGTVQHEVLEGSRAVDFQDGDSITIKVNCRADAGEILEPVRYGLAVTLEVAEGISIPVYQEVKDRLRIRIPISTGRSRDPGRSG